MRPTPEEHTAHVRRFLTDVLTGRDVEAFDAFVTEDLVTHDLVFEDGGQVEGARPTREAVLAAATDVDVTVEETVAEGDIVAVRATVSGTYEGSLLTLRRSGDSFEIAYVWFYRIEGGRIAEAWSLPDGLGLVRQLGRLSGESTNRSPTD